MTTVKTLPEGEKAREIDSLALHELVEAVYKGDVPETAFYYPSKRGGYVHVSPGTVDKLIQFIGKIKTSAEENKYNAQEGIEHGSYMLWKHSNEKAKNRELFFRFKNYPAVELPIPVEYLLLP